MSTATYALLRMTDPDRWRVAALAWRRWAALAGALGAEFGPVAARLRAAWSGAGASAATAALVGFRRRLALFRVLCWRADQALSEFASALARARDMLSRARGRADRCGLVIDDRGTVHGASPELPGVAAELSAALSLAATADTDATARLGSLIDAGSAEHRAPGPRPDCTAGAAEVRRWWDGLSPDQRNWLLATEPATLASTAGIPAADRDVANRLILDDQRAGGADEVRARIEDDTVLRPYLIGLNVSGDGRAVIALGDPDRARHVLTHVPGMTSDLESFGSELTRAERVAVRAHEVAPGEAVSAVLWLDYDAPDFVHEAWSDRQAREGAEGLRRFQESLRVTHDGPPADQTVLGHSYGSLVVGTAAAGSFAADRVVFVGSPGVGVDSASQLSVPAWSTTSRSDAIQYAAVSPGSLVPDVALAGRVPLIGPAIAFGLPEDDLWFGRNPSDPAFGARVFPSQADAGHLGYWDPGRPALDALARITAAQEPVIRP
ncbi:alpha/beta hydrolase [Actinoplanes sp. NPDC023936]|uniref:alpha/beta hydrolase n=1 Tax=Actinoplanes sp. NPDC023936 TaxID=3154910 RepID=UPI0033F074C8